MTQNHRKKLSEMSESWTLERFGSEEATVTLCVQQGLSTGHIAAASSLSTPRLLDRAGR